MTCPHCLVDFNDAQTLWTVLLDRDSEGQWIIAQRTCPTCKKLIFHIGTVNLNGAFPRGQQNPPIVSGNSSVMVRPKTVARVAVSPDVPNDIAKDYREACLVLADSPKASAALSRRCLQNVLRTAAGVKHSDLAREIQEVLDGGKLPASIATNIDAIRNIGNFAAHPIKSQSTGEIVDVEPHEAEWNLDVLEELFDFFFVQPAKAAAKKAALDKKLADAGKPPSK
jgi:Domain of unknown function (DUF4145)